MQDTQIAKRGPWLFRFSNKNLEEIQNGKKNLWT